MKLSFLWKNKDVLGWLIWIVLTLVLIAPCIWMMYQFTYDTASTLTRVAAGIFAAAIGAGVVNWLGNEAWFRIRRRQFVARRKSARKARRSR